MRSIEGRLPLIPRYRQKVRGVEFGLAAPAWFDDPDFDLQWHIRSTALPTPGGRSEIERLLSRVMSRPMDRNRPLWEYWFCEGLDGGRWGLLSKMHHSMGPREVIGQAIDALMHRDGVSRDAAFERLVQDSAADRCTVREIAAEIAQPRRGE